MTRVTKKQLSKYRTHSEKWSSRLRYKQRGRKSLCLSKDQLSYPAARVVAPPFSSDVLANPFRTKKKRPVYTSLRIRRKALQENSFRGVSASVPYFARRYSNSAKGLRGFTSITEIHREAYNGHLVRYRRNRRSYRSRSTLVFRGCNRKATKCLYTFCFSAKHGNLFTQF